MIPESFRGRAEASAKAHPLQKKDWQSFAVSIKNAVPLALTPFDP